MRFGAIVALICVMTLAFSLPSAVTATTPSSPQDLQVTSGMIYVDLSWKAPAIIGDTPVTSYSLYKGQDSSDMGMVANITGNITAYHDENVDAGLTYFYQVTAWNEKNESVWSNTVVVTIPTLEKTDDGTLLGVAAIAVAAVAIQMAIVALWVLLKKGNQRQ